MRFSALGDIINDDIEDLDALESLGISESLVTSLAAQKSAFSASLGLDLPNIDLSGLLGSSDFCADTALKRLQEQVASSCSALTGCSDFSSAKHDLAQLTGASSQVFKQTCSVAASSLMEMTGSIPYVDPVVSAYDELKVAAAGLACGAADSPYLRAPPLASSFSSAIKGASALAVPSSAPTSFNLLLEQTRSILRDLNAVAGVESSGLSTAARLNQIGVLPSAAVGGIAFQNSYVDDLRESVAGFHKAEEERLRKLAEVRAWRLADQAKQNSEFGLSSLTGRVERFIERHGRNFTLKQIYVFEAVARTAENLLATRNLRKIRGKLDYIRWAASYGSKLLCLYALLMGILCLVAKKASLEKPKLFEKNLKRFVKCLSPPPTQPLSRLPKVKANAPNIAA